MTSGKIFGIAIAAAVVGGGIGAAGYAWFGPENTRDVRVEVVVTPSPTPSLTPSPSESPEASGSAARSDSAAIFTAVQQYDGNSGSLSAPRIVGMYAMTTQARGATYFLKKTNGTWQVISAGNGQSVQELKDLGIPSGLYR